MPTSSESERVNDPVIWEKWGPSHKTGWTGLVADLIIRARS